MARAIETSEKLSRCAKATFRDLSDARCTLYQAVEYQFAVENGPYSNLWGHGDKIQLLKVLNCIVARITSGSKRRKTKRPEAGLRVEIRWQKHRQEYKATGHVDSSLDQVLNCDIAVILFRIYRSIRTPNFRDESGFSRLRNEILGRANREILIPLSTKDITQLAKPWKPSEARNHDSYDFWMAIDVNGGVYADQLRNIRDLTDTSTSACSIWRPYFLNDLRLIRTQQPCKLAPHTCKDPNDQTKFDMRFKANYAKLRKWAPGSGCPFTWNNEQLKVLSQLEEPRGRMIVVSGPAGTGKTTLIAAITWFFYSIGFHVIIDSPTNKSVEDMTARLDNLPMPVPVGRILPAGVSKTFGDIGVESKPATGAESLKNQKLQDWASRTRSETKTKFGRSQKHHLHELVLKSADDGKASYFLTYPFTEDSSDGKNQKAKIGTEKEDVTKSGVVKCSTAKKDENTDNVKSVAIWIHTIENGQLERVPIRRGDRLDMWQYFRVLLRRARHTPMSEWETYDHHDDIDSRDFFAELYDHCIGYVLAHLPVICATSASSHHGEMIASLFASGMYGARKCIGVAVLKEEAAKDVEPTFWGSIVHPSWARKVKLVMAFGDHRQLEPFAIGKPDDPDLSQMKMSYFHRYIGQGGDHIELVEQNRMHESIARIPSLLAYENKLRTVGTRRRAIDDDLPGMRARLETLYRKAGHTASLSDEDIRVHAFEVPGHVYLAGTSRYNMEQIRFAIDFILPCQMEYFGRKASRKCLWITGYGANIKMIEHELNRIQQIKMCTASEMPAVSTIDSSQGHEADWVVMFTVANQAKDKYDLGFLTDDRRIVVGTTRAKNIFSYVHGPFEGSSLYDAAYMVCRYLRLLGVGQKTECAQPDFDRKSLPKYRQDDKTLEWARENRD